LKIQDTDMFYKNIILDNIKCSICRLPKKGINHYI